MASNLIEQKFFDGGGGGINHEKKYRSELTDSYMTITYIVYDLGNSEFLFSIDANWDKMPVFRMLDSLGAACMNMTVINSTRKGYYEYELNNEIKKCDLGVGGMQEAINGNWYGSACKFMLSSGIPEMPYTQFRVHYEYKGHYNGSNDNPYINTFATYCHQRIILNVSPSIEINTNGKPTIGFASDFSLNHEYRTVSFPYDIKVTI